MLALELAVEWLSPEFILAVAALVTAIAGLLTAIAAWRRHGKSVAKTAEEECLERLRVARVEAEELALEVHERRIREALEP